jgi:hypothetical protein
MNCSVLQRRLLELEQPDRPPPEVRAHLAACAVCRRWQRRLVQIEQRVPLIPVPTSSAKSALMRRVLAEPAAAAKEPNSANGQKLRPFIHGGQPRHRAPQKIALATALAAGLLLFAVGFGALQQSQKEPARPPFSQSLTARLVQHDLKLAAATKPSERVKVLANLAEELHTESNALARTASADDLKALSQLYKRVVGEGLVNQATKVSPGERLQVLDPIIHQLEDTANDALELAKTVSPAAATELQDIAKAADAAKGQLRNLTGEIKT